MTTAEIINLPSDLHPTQSVYDQKTVGSSDDKTEVSETTDVSVNKNADELSHAFTNFAVVNSEEVNVDDGINKTNDIEEELNYTEINPDKVDSDEDINSIESY